MDIAEEVYASVLGLTLEEYRLGWVPDLSAPGQPCYEAYRSMLQAYQRVLTRLGKENEDKDLEEMVNAMLAYSKAAALEMFACGRKYQARQTES